MNVPLIVIVALGQMSETIVEIYELQHFSKRSGSKWIPHEDTPWLSARGSSTEASLPPDEVQLPSRDWCWGSNWRYVCIVLVYFNHVFTVVSTSS